MTRPITIALQVRDKGRRDVQITPRWVGQGLAVHKPVISNGNGEPVFDYGCSGIWTLTHIHTGLCAGIFMGSLDRAKAFAREWDEAWAAVTSKSKVPARLRKDYLAALATATLEAEV
jgi:hypothetical protein